MPGLKCQAPNLHILEIIAIAQVNSGTRGKKLRTVNPSGGTDLESVLQLEYF